MQQNDPDYGKWSMKFLRPGQHNMRMAADRLGIRVSMIGSLRDEWGLGKLRVMSATKFRKPQHTSAWVRKFWIFTDEDLRNLQRAWILRAFRAEDNRRRAALKRIRSDRPAPRYSPYIAITAKRLHRARRLNALQYPWSGSSKTRSTSSGSSPTNAKPTTTPSTSSEPTES